MTITINQSGEETVYQADKEIIESVVDILTGNERLLTIEDIRDAVSRLTGITDIANPSQKREFVIARQLYCFMSDKRTRSLPAEIGRLINRDRTTVIHSIQTLQDLCDTDDKIRADVSRLTNMLRGKGVEAPKKIVYKTKRIEKEPPAKVIVRAPAEYTNQRPYDFNN